MGPMACEVQSYLLGTKNGNVPVLVSSFGKRFIPSYGLTHLLARWTKQFYNHKSTKITIPQVLSPKSIHFHLMMYETTEYHTKSARADHRKKFLKIEMAGRLKNSMPFLVLLIFI